MANTHMRGRGGAVSFSDDEIYLRRENFTTSPDVSTAPQMGPPWCKNCLLTMFLSSYAPAHWHQLSCVFILSRSLFVSVSCVYITPRSLYLLRLAAFSLSEAATTSKQKTQRASHTIAEPRRAHAYTTSPELPSYIYL